MESYPPVTTTDKDRAAALDQLVSELAQTIIGNTTNPYACYDPALDQPDGAAIRTANLRRYLHAHAHPRLLLVGEAPGYRGCRFSGIPFTSERDLPRDQHSSRHPRGWREPSATIVHGALQEFGIEEMTLLWNACPLHPAGAGPLTNRAPTRAELAAGRIWLERLRDLVQPDHVAAIGRVAGSLLPEVPVLRHPARGGATLFRIGLLTLTADWDMLPADGF